jgi:hypothetical protein
VQAEQFANELSRHLAIAAPDCRIVRQVRRCHGGCLLPGSSRAMLSPSRDTLGAGCLPL